MTVDLQFSFPGKNSITCSFPLLCRFLQFSVFQPRQQRERLVSQKTFICWTLRPLLGSLALTGVVDGHGDRQRVAHTSVQTVGAHRHHLDHIAGVG